MSVVVLQPGENVPGPGQYIMPMDDYHRQCCPGPSISSGGLRTIYLQSPADFWAYSDLNEFRFDEPTRDYFVFGRAAHSLLLGDEDFKENFAVVPKTAPPKPTEAQIAARARGNISTSAAERFFFWDEFNQINAGKDYLSEADLIHIEHISDKLNDHPFVGALLEGLAEQSLIWQDDLTGVWLKSRLDILSVTGDLADLKSTSQTNVNLIKRDVRKHGYDMQLGLATMALENVLGMPFDPETYSGRSAILLFVYKKPPYHIMPVEVDFDALHWARLKCRQAINTFAHCLKTGEWPGVMHDEIATVTADWEAEDLAEKQSAGLLPNDAYSFARVGAFGDQSGG